MDMSQRRQPLEKKKRINSWSHRLRESLFLTVLRLGCEDQGIIWDRCEESQVFEGT